ncbi:hypothetical protein CDAR_246211 [Caerostris darwini]|uniref:Uncharacterized protein n=1 Tax=Caerostris darwini TaxID=1538125 RepID=A0AAV4W845_9ARAC|nr:hypothetical protein CDAR_246211 [Caerostris darwini]
MSFSTIRYSQCPIRLLNMPAICLCPKNSLQTHRERNLRCQLPMSKFWTFYSEATSGGTRHPSSIVMGPFSEELFRAEIFLSAPPAFVFKEVQELFFP